MKINFRSGEMCENVEFSRKRQKTFHDHEQKLEMVNKYFLIFPNTKKATPRTTSEMARDQKIISPWKS